MKTKVQVYSVLLALAVLFGCEVAPKPIAYGEINCAHCNMTVSDSRYGAEIVNTKGKPFFFDSAECLASYLNENPEKKQEAKLVLVTDFTKPNELVDAQQAVFLQSKNMPSPMGMFLTGFADKATAEEFQQQHSGKLLTWEQTLLTVKSHEKPE